MTDSRQRVALVTGASGGIGLALVETLLADETTAAVYAGCRNPSRAVALIERRDEDSRLKLVELDVTRDRTIAKAADQVNEEWGRVDLVINTAGVLHNVDGMQPEKRLADIDCDNLMLAYDVNALGAMRLAMHLEPLLKAGKAPRFVSLSARVGSIGDNRLGGWYAYRASKAALNMLLKTLSIEWARLKPGIVCAALHPGTVATALSDPFTSGKDKSNLSTPEQSAAKLLAVIESLTPEQTGSFFAYDGQEIPW